MKSLFTFLFIAFLTHHTAFAQSPEQTNLVFKPIRTTGIKGGVNLASISNLDKSDIYMGFHVGFFGNVQTTAGFGFGGEINFSRQGVSVNNVDIGLNYLSIPVLLNFYDGPVTFQGGVYGAFLFNANLATGLKDEDITSYLKTTDYGLLIGIIFSPSGHTFFGMRMNFGAENINDHLAKPYTAELYNRNLQVFAGVKF